MPGIKLLTRRALAQAGLDVQRIRNVPFGTRWEADLQYCLGNRPLGLALDVGAHFGETALKLTQTFQGVEVHSFEPLPENFATLKHATAATSVRCVNAAVSDTSGTIALSRGRSSFHAGAHDGGPTIPVQSITIDEYVSSHRLEGVSLLKIDTEGHESAVLRGARGQLDSGGVEFVFCECEFTARKDEPHGSFREIFDQLEPLGYKIVSFYTNGVDNLGWLWGDVMFRYAPGARDLSSVTCSPFDR